MRRLIAFPIAALHAVIETPTANRLKQFIGRGSLGPPLVRLQRRAAPFREGFQLLSAMFLARLPSRRARTFLARHLLGLKISPHVTLYQWRDIRHAPGIEIGEGSIIGFWATLDGRRGIKIGRNVNLSSEVALWTLQHDPNHEHFGVGGGPIVIEDHAWISFRATILPGVHIGRGAVVAANSVVSKDIEDYAIVGGIPAKVIGQRSRKLSYSFSGGGPWFV